MFNTYPYTDFHEMNLEWFLIQFKELVDNWDQFRADLTAQWDQVSQDWETLYNYVHDYFDNLDVQEEIDNKLDEMVANGSLLTIIQPTVIDATGDWLEENLTPTSPPVDSTLTISGAAADAKVTGDQLTDLKEELNSILVPSIFTNYSFIQGTLNTDTGATSGNLRRCRTINYIKFDNNCVKITITPKNGYKYWIAKYTIQDTSGYIDHTSFTTEAADITDPELYYRFVVGTVTDDEITPSDLPDDVLTFIEYLPTDETLSLNSKAADAKITGDKINKISSMINAEQQVKLPFSLSGGYINTAGNVVNSDEYLHTDYIDITGFTHIEYTRGSSTDSELQPQCMAIYDENKRLVRSTRWARNGDINGYIIGNIYPAEGDKYARISAYADTDTYGEFDIYGVAYPLKTAIEELTFKYIEKTQEFEHFTVSINLGYPDMNSTTSSNAENENLSDLLCVLALPESYSPKITDNPTPLIMFCHGASCQITEDSWYNNNANFISMIRSLVSAGYAVFDVNNTRDAAGGFADWGSFALMEGYIKAWEYIKANYNVEHKLYLLSDSMGTCANLNMLKWYSGDILTSIMTAPRPLNKYRYPDLTDIQKKQMLVSWGIEPDTILNDDTYIIPDNTVFTDDKYKGLFHVENVISIANTEYITENFPPVKVLVGTGDIDFLNYTRQYYSALRNYGNLVNYREIAGATHGQMSFLSIGSLTQEVINWFNRFKN